MAEIIITATSAKRTDQTKTIPNIFMHEFKKK